MNLVVTVVTLFILQNVDARPKKVEEMYLERTRMSDLDSSASGYVYQQTGLAPESYVSVGLGSALGGHGAKYEYINPVSVEHYVQHTPQYVPQYVAKPQPFVYTPVVQPVVQPIVQSVVQPKVELENYGNVGNLNDALGVVDEEANKYAYGEGVNMVKQNDGLGNLDGGNKAGSEASSYEKGEGQSYNEAHHGAKGEKGEEGYKNHHAFEKGAQGKHDKEGHKGFYNDVGGKKTEHSDEGSHYGEHHAAEKGSQGSSFHESKGHKKGSKTTGYHNVYHKDEYKKDHSFYDESDNSGHYEKHGEEGSHHSSAEGGHKKGGNADAGYHKENYGKKGFHDKGHYLGNDRGFKGAHGGDSYYSNEENYGKKDGSNEGKSYGYSEGNGALGKGY